MSELFADGVEQDAPKSKDTPRWVNFDGVAGHPEHFVMQYKEFDLYVAKRFFTVRWGRDYCARQDYGKIKQADGHRFALPPEVQSVLLAARAMIFGELT